jgi:N-acetylglutamate synthase-like GNAT family acetyltransferase
MRFRGKGRMNMHSSSSEGYEHGRSFDTLLVRSFQPSDRLALLRLHAAAAPSGFVDCDCATNIDLIEETYFRRPQDHFWVAEARGEIVGTIGICMHDENVAHVYCLRTVDNLRDDLIRRGLVQVAATHAHQQGCLKLVVHSPNAQVDIGRATTFLHQLGFEFSRHREIDQRAVLEFYLNLYERPELAPQQPPPSPLIANLRQKWA